MRIGIHLPQYGRVAGRDAIVEAARLAEDLGFVDVWVSDHIVHPATQDYPSPHLVDPIVTLSWAAAVTERVRLGTSVWVAPLHHPVESANTLASLDVLSGGRLTIGVGVGWSEAEFDALGQRFGDRGDRTDEILDLWRACWRDDPVRFEGEHYRLDDVRVLPQPVGDMPIWVGGGTERAHRRAVERGDGFQLIGLKPDRARPVIERIRRDRPEESFTISLRTGWDPNGMDPDEIVAEHAAYADAGVQHVVAAPWRKDLDSWLDSMRRLADLTDLGA
jgi:probable F420-dependent oxidoreductase